MLEDRSQERGVARQARDADRVALEVLRAADVRLGDQRRERLPDQRADRDVLEQWAKFDADIGIVKAPPDVDDAFDLTLADG